MADEYDGDELPTETLLMEEFGVSRPTVRTALQQLVADGLITRQPGIGTRIKREGRTGYWAIGSLDDLTGEFRLNQAITLSAKLEPVRNYPAARDVFGLNDRASIFRIKRVMANEGLPYAVSNLFGVEENTTDIPPDQLGRTYFIDLVQTHSGKIASRVHQEIGAIAADDDMAQSIGVDEGAPLLFVQRTYLDNDDQPLVYVELKCRTDRYKQIVNFIRGPQPLG